MRNLLSVGVFAPFVAALLVTACGPAAEEVVVIDPPAETQTAVNAAPVNSCEDIAKLAAAMSEPVPFASLRTGNVKLGETVVEDTFTTAAAPAGAPCTLAVMDGMSAETARIHVANCPVFSSGLLDREANAEKAKLAFDTLRGDLEKCLPKGWDARDGSQPDADSTEMLIFESPEDAKISMDASFYTYPVQLKKAWDNGWKVTLNFQKDGPK